LRGNWAWLPRAAGLVLAVASAIWLLRELGGSGAATLAGLGNSLRRGVLPAIGAVTLLLGLQATAWWWLCGLRESEPDWRAAVSVWARSQAGKYLPGNVMHFVGRQLAASELGLTQTSVMAASVSETFCMLGGSLFLGGATVLTGSGSVPPRVTVVAVAVMAAGAVVALVLNHTRLADSLPWNLGLRPGSLARRGALATLLCLVLHTGVGLTFFVLLDLADPGAAPHVLRVAGAYGLAWAGGLIAFGLPAGLGVREALLVYQLKGEADAATIAAAALALRLVQVSADGLAFVLGWLARPAKIEADGTEEPKLPR